MLKLYYAPGTRAIRPRWLLEEIGAPYEIVRLDLAAGDQRKPEYLRLNPNGAVPTLVDDGVVLYESAAIVQYLVDKFPEAKLAPKAGTAERGKYYQWIHYTMSALEPPAVAISVHAPDMPFSRPEGERVAQLVPESRAQLAAALKVVDDAVAGKPFIIGNAFSAADVMVGSMVGWCAMLGLLGNDVPNVMTYLGNLAARPAAVRAQVD